MREKLAETQTTLQEVNSEVVEVTNEVTERSAITRQFKVELNDISNMMLEVK